MSLSTIISLLIDRKNIMNTILSCLVGLIIVLIGMFKCDPAFLNYLFAWIIPGAGIVTLGVYAVSMTKKHPIILVFPSIMIYSSLLIRYLITYEYHIVLFILLQTIPYFLFCLQAKRFKHYKLGRDSLFIGICSCVCFLIAFIAVLLLDKADIVCIPHYRYLQYEILCYIELLQICHFTALAFLNKELHLVHFEKETEHSETI